MRRNLTIVSPLVFVVASLLGGLFVSFLAIPAAFAGDFDEITTAANFDWCFEDPAALAGADAIDLRFEVEAIPLAATNGEYFGAFIRPYVFLPEKDEKLFLLEKEGVLTPTRKYGGQDPQVFNFQIWVWPGKIEGMTEIKRVTSDPLDPLAPGGKECQRSLNRQKLEVWVETASGILKLDRSRQKWIAGDAMVHNPPAAYALALIADAQGPLHPDWRFEIPAEMVRDQEEPIRFDFTPIPEAVTGGDYRGVEMTPYVVSGDTAGKYYFARRGGRYRPVPGLLRRQAGQEQDLLSFHLCFFETNLKQAVQEVAAVRIDAKATGESSINRQEKKLSGNFRNLAYEVLVRSGNEVKKLVDAKEKWIFGDVIQPLPPARFALVLLPAALSAETYALPEKEAVSAAPAMPPAQAAQIEAELKDENAVATVVEEIPPAASVAPPVKPPVLAESKPATKPEKKRPLPSAPEPQKAATLQAPAAEAIPEKIEAVKEVLPATGAAISGEIQVIVTSREEGKVQRLNNAKGVITYQGADGREHTIPLAFNPQETSYSARIEKGAGPSRLSITAGRGMEEFRGPLTSNSATVELNHRGPFLYVAINPSSQLQRGPIRRNVSLNFNRFKEKFLDLVISLTAEEKWQKRFGKTFIYAMNQGLSPDLLLDPGDLAINWLDSGTREQVLKRIQLRNSFISYDTTARVVAESLAGYSFNDEQKVRGILVYIMGAPPTAIFDPAEELAPLEAMLRKEKMLGVIAQFADSTSRERLDITADHKAFRNLRLLEMNIEQEFSDLYFGAAMEYVRENLAALLAEH